MLTLNQINDIIDSKISMNRPAKILNLFSNRCFIYDYIKNFYRYNENLDKSTFIVAIIYVQRYNKVCKLTSSNIKPVLETCLILANKYCIDYEIMDSGPLESHLLNSINWNLYISETEFNHYKNVIMACTNFKFL